MRWPCWLVLVVACSCGQRAMTGPDAGCTVDFTLGTPDNDNRFVPLVENMDMPVSQGPQGGYHLFVAARVLGLPRSGTLRWSLHSVAGVELAKRSLDIATIRLEDIECGWQRSRDLLIFTTDDIPSLQNVPARLTGQLGEVQKTFMVVPR